MELQDRHRRAPELFGDYWFNSEPISARALRGYVMLISFWDYTCVHCQRTLPYLNEWFRRYRNLGLVMVGVHTPEYRFGRNPEHVERAIRTAGIEYPVVMDNDALVWSAYACRDWPTKFLIDKDGFIRYVHSGEGQYQQFERAIQALLRDTGVYGELPALMTPLRDEDWPEAVCYRPTSEVHLGYLRGSLGNAEGYSPESTVEYSDPGLYVPGRFYAAGTWLSEKEFLRFNGQPSQPGSITLNYESLEVNAVLAIEKGKSCEIVVEQDGLPLTPENRGEDVQLLEGGTSMVRVESPRMYNLVRNREFGGHTIRLQTDSPFAEIFSFTFVTSAVPELVSRN
jgi:thiol-disulfide isomerase/thioredoxin